MFYLKWVDGKEKMFLCLKRDEFILFFRIVVYIWNINYFFFLFGYFELCKVVVMCDGENFF